MTVSGAHFIGLRVGSGSLTIRDSKVVGSAYLGVGIYQAGMHATSFLAEFCEISGNAAVGVLAYESSTTVTLRETTIQDTLPMENGEAGYGVYVYEAADLELEACELSGNAAAGIIACETDTTVMLRETTIQDTQPGESGDGGYGIEVYGGANLEAEACEVSANTRVGVLVSESGTTVALRETAIQGTLPSGNGEGGFGIDVHGGANLVAESCELVGNTLIGLVVARAGTEATLREVVIQDTRADDNGEHGYGVEVYDGASLDAESCEVVANTSIGIAAFDPGTTVTLQDTTIRDTQPNETGSAGCGIKVSGGASLSAESCALAQNTEVGVLAIDADTSVSLYDVLIQDTQPGKEATGFGIDVYAGAQLEAEACELAGNASTGIIASDEGTALQLRETTIRDTQPATDADGYGIRLLGGASLYAESCEVKENTRVGLYAHDDGTSVTLLDTTILDSQSTEKGKFGRGIEVSDGASLEAQACELSNNRSVAGSKIPSSRARPSRRTSEAAAASMSSLSATVPPRSLSPTPPSGKTPSPAYGSTARASTRSQATPSTAERAGPARA